METELTWNVCTSDDVVEFYAKYGQDSPVAFFFCVRTDSGLLFRPYDLTVVAREEVRDDYYTISATGVMHMRKGQRAGMSTQERYKRCTGPVLTMIAHHIV